MNPARKRRDRGGTRRGRARICQHLLLFVEVFWENGKGRSTFLAGEEQTRLAAHRSHHARRAWRQRPDHDEFDDRLSRLHAAR